jgi:hypothetical protein
MLKAGSAIRFLPRLIDPGTLTTLSRGIKNAFDLHADRSGVILSTIHLRALLKIAKLFSPALAQMEVR